MSFSERMFYFQADVWGRDADRERWAASAERREKLEELDRATTRRLAAEYAERQRTRGLEERHRLALAFLRRVPLDRVATTRAEVARAVGRDLLVRDDSDRDAWAASRHQRADREAHESVVAFLMRQRHVFDDGVAYPEVEVVAQHLAGLDSLVGWNEYLSLPHVMVAERIYRRLTNFERCGPPERPQSGRS